MEYKVNVKMLDSYSVRGWEEAKSPIKNLLKFSLLYLEYHLFYAGVNNIT
jgi:hypothetical protein